MRVSPVPRAAIPTHPDLALQSGRSRADAWYMNPLEPFRSAPKPLPAKQILVVDDDRTTVHLMVTRLRSRGFEATAAYDAMQAVMHARRTAPDAILLDLYMPGGSGLDVLRRLRAMTPTASTPILIVSGHISREARRCARERWITRRGRR